MGVITEKERQKYFAYLDGVADGLKESRNDVNSVLDKISTEIDGLEWWCNGEDYFISRKAVKCILDKYKAEGEG